ncbi:HD domain-containing protein [Halomonas sp. V046]|uniref:HD domain-containing protein n=1 Tax=Halomonas sp. V046 TaxID=3459611 RepID=UPI0040446A28
MCQLIQRASLFSRAAHQAIGQRRKYTGEPYWHHPAVVAALVQAAPSATEEMVAAAHLHDVVEDTEVTHDDIAREFGAVVAAHVVDLTDQFTDPGLGNRAHRKALERGRLASIAAGSQTIKYADLIDNTSSITRHDPGFARVYMAEKAELLAVMRDGDAALLERASGLVERYLRCERG